jgi:hypothetical protein
MALLPNRVDEALCAEASACDVTVQPVSHGVPFASFLCAGGYL